MPITSWADQACGPGGGHKRPRRQRFDGRSESLCTPSYLTDFQEEFVTARQTVLGLRGAAKKIATLK